MIMQANKIDGNGLTSHIIRVMTQEINQKIR